MSALNEFVSKHIAIIGGGAAGFFAAVNCAEMYPQHSITIFEKGSKLLSKVRVSGGGRCNVTHACFDIHLLAKNYPRGEKQLKSAFSRFMTNDTINWFAKRGVELKTEADGRMFPVTDSSQTIIDCLMREADKHQVKIEMNTDVLRLEKEENEGKSHSNSQKIPCKNGILNKSYLLSNNGS